MIKKYHDLNQNGRRDDNEPGLNGWTFTAYDQQGNAVDTDITRTGRSTGQPGWTGFGLPVGVYSICETMLEGWINTDPGGSRLCITVSISSDERQTIYFGNTEDEPVTPDTGILSVHKYHDLNNNGQRDDDEPGLNDWQIVVYDRDSGEVASDFTHDRRRSGEPGWLRFELAEGEYRVCEILQDGWINTDPGRERPCQRVTVFAGERQRIVFGNAQEEPPAPSNGVLSVHKYFDQNSNAQYDDGEPGLNGWQIVVYDLEGQEIASEITRDRHRSGEPGWLRFGLTAGEYRVCEVLQQGWVNTDPGRRRPCQRVTIVNGERQSIYFGNARENPLAPSAPANEIRTQEN